MTSELTGVIGLTLTVCSTRHIVVERTSSVIDGFPNTAYNAFVQLPTSRYQSLTEFVAAGGLKFQLITCWTNCYLFLSLFHVATYSLNSQSAPMKFVPVSLIIFNGLPHRAMNRIIAFRQLSLSIFRKISICPARTVRLVKRQHQRFLFLRPIFTVNGPKWSIPTFENTVDATNRLQAGLLFLVSLAPFFRHVMHLLLTDRKTFRMPRIQNLFWIMFLNSSVSSW